MRFSVIRPSLPSAYCCNATRIGPTAPSSTIIFLHGSIDNKPSDLALAYRDNIDIREIDMYHDPPNSQRL